ncbi:MAG TPA: lyase family protein, partial [Turneriella sp.]|nr:lyase family protein [Turneriella sp.]
MIDRYSTPEIRKLWSLQRKFEVWRDIEIAACEYWHTKGNITNAELNDIRTKSTFTVERVNEIENEIHHDVIAFLTALAENIGPASRHVHFGLTSSDIVDTAQMVLILEAGALIDKALGETLTALY